MPPDPTSITPLLRVVTPVVLMRPPVPALDQRPGVGQRRACRTAGDAGVAGDVEGRAGGMTSCAVSLDAAPMVHELN